MNNNARPRPTVPSPCIGVCTLDLEGICLGCCRSQDEIREWLRLTDEERLQVLENCQRRREE